MSISSPASPAHAIPGVVSATARLMATFAAAWLLTGAAAAGATTPAVPAAATDVQLSLPAPTGRNAVGVRSAFVADPSRTDPATGGPRTLPVRIWYPTSHPQAGTPARYLSPAVQAVIEGALGAPEGTFDIDTHASAGAPMRHRVRGVILVSPGFGNLVAFHTAQAIDLASRGWAVVTFDHPHDTFVVEGPDGTLIPIDGETLEHVALAFTQRVPDVRLVLDHLSALVPGYRPSTPVGMYGHSLGGAAAAETMLVDARVRAGVNLDGGPRGAVVQQGLDRPFGLMHEPFAPGDFEFLFKQFIAGLRGPHPIVELPVAHNGFTDFVVFNPQAAAADPALGALLEARVAAGVASVEAGLAALSEQRRFLSGFMRRYVGDRRHGGARGVAPTFDARPAFGGRKVGR